MNQGNGHRPLILLVDDDDETRSMIKVALDMWEYNVVEAKNGLEAVEVAKRERPDLILMDILMPILDGFTATCRIRENGALRDVPVVVITAQGETGAECYLGLEEPIEYVTKPIDLDELRTILRSLLHGS